MFDDVALALQLQIQRSRMASMLQGLGACIMLLMYHQHSLAHNTDLQ